jgi:hypothetical protein
MLAPLTPGTALIDFSTRMTQEAQVIPVTCSLMSDRAAVFMKASGSCSILCIVKVLTMARSTRTSDSACCNCGLPE